MHPNPAFRAESTDHHITFARDRAFGILAVTAEAHPLLSHVPFLLNDDASHADLHLVRSNPIVRALKQPQPARIAVSGPDGYVSPDWYGIVDQVPTWNYVAVHLTGMLEQRPQAELRDLLDRQTAFFEERLLPKPPWRASKMTDDVLQRFLRMIVPCRLRISQIDGTWKLNQNKADEARHNAADRIAADGFGVELQSLRELMLGVTPSKS